jgi:hypothetical protein
MNTTWKLAALAALAAAASACAPSYNIIGMEDHPERDLTIIDVEVSRPRIPGIYYIVAHEYWLCREAEGALDCKRACTPLAEVVFEGKDDPSAVLCPNVGEGVRVQRTENPNLNVTRPSIRPAEPPTPPPADEDEEPPTPPPAEEGGQP